MNFINAFKRHVQTDNLSNAYQNFMIEKDHIQVKLSIQGKKVEVIIYSSHIEIEDSDFKSSGVSLWDDFDEIENYLVTQVDQQ